MQVSLPLRLEKYTMPEPNSGCWLWDGSLSQSGYPQIWVNGKSESAHRVRWTLVNGPIPDGMFVCHKCDVPICTNPDHLFLGTQAENMTDKANKGRADRRPGDKHPLAKLSNSDVEEIRALRATGLRQWQLGQIFGIGQDQISRILSRKAWRI